MNLRKSNHEKYSVWFGDFWMNTYDAWSAEHAISQCNDQFGADCNYRAKEESK